MSSGHRERLRRAMRHEAPDRVPLSFGGINTVAYRALVEYLGFEQEEIEAARGIGSGAVVAGSERVLRHFDIDVRGVSVGQPAGFPVELDSDSFRDQWGVTWRRSGPTAPDINVRGPLEALDEPTPAHLDAIPWPDPEDPVRYRALAARVQQLRRDTDYAIVLGIGNSAFALAQRLRGFGLFLEDLLLYPDFATALLERVNDVVCGFATAALQEVGDEIDLITFGDDMGTQRSSYMRLELYRSMVKPHHRRLVETIRRHTDATVVMHSDGAIYSLLPDLVDCGVQGINPVQVSAAGMDPERLKREFGDELCFWGGIDTQSVLPFGSPAEVADEVRARLGDLGRGGGYLLSSVHNIQAEVPPANIVAMFETALEAS